MVRQSSPKSASDYCEFASGWYQGYGAFLLVEFAAGSKGTIKDASNAGDLRHALDDAAELANLQGLRHIDAPDVPAGQVQYRLVANEGSPQIDAADVTRHLREDHGIETSGGIKHALDQLDGNIHHLEDLSSSEQAALAARLSKSSDPSAARAFVTDLDDAGDVRVLLDQDQTTVNRLVDWHANPGSYRHIDPDLEPDEFMSVVRHGNPDNTRMVVKGPDANNNLHVQWLEKGNLDAGWEHIQARHIEGTHRLDAEDATSLFPTGREVKGQRLPNTVSDDEVVDMIYDSIKKGQPTQQGQKTRYYFEPEIKGYPDSGINDMQVIVRPDGSVETAFPLSGDDVKRWVPDLNDGQGGFVDAT